MRYGWQLKKQSWDILGTCLEAGTWKRKYLERDYASAVPESSGVYVICGTPSTIPIDGDLAQKLYNALYVGQATDLRQRFKQHVVGYRDVRDAKATFRRLEFWYMAIPASLLDSFEQALISAFGPPANVKNVVAQIGNPVPAGQIRKPSQ